MKIIVHRAQDFEPGLLPHHWGVELDVRDCQGKAVLAHDPATGGETALHTWLMADRHRQKDAVRPFYALNIKADGLEDVVRRDLSLAFAAEIPPGVFVFDMSFPSLMRYKARKVPFAERLSEHERDQNWGEHLWVDHWYWSEPPDGPYLSRFNAGRPHIAVSPELHLGDTAQPSFVEWFWRRCFDAGMAAVCTDWPARLEERLTEWEGGAE